MEQIDIREDAQNVRPLFLIIFLTILIVIVNKLDAFVTVINLSLKISDLLFHLGKGLLTLSQLLVDRLSFLQTLDSGLCILNSI